MWNPYFVLLQLQFPQLRHGDAERALDSPQPRLASFRSAACDLFQEVATERLPGKIPAGEPLRLPHQWGKNVEVPYRVEEPVDLAKGLVRADSFQVSLPQALRVFLVVGVRPTKHRLAPPFDSFLLDPRLALIVLHDAEAVPPFRRIRGLAKLHVQRDGRLHRA